MFPEKGIFGISRRNIDKKGRIFLPKFTNAEEKDQLVICLESPEYLTLYNVETLTKRVQELRKGILASKNQDTINKLEAELEKIFHVCITKCNVDSQHRILIPAEFVSKMKFCGEVVVMGTDDSIRISNPDNIESDEFGSLTKKM